MKNDQKNPIYPSVLVSCMLEQLIDAQIILMAFKYLHMEFEFESWIQTNFI